MGDLEFYTTEELIGEIVRRSTFAGLLIYSSAQHTYPGQCHEDFKIKSSCDVKSSIHLLKIGLQTMQSQTSEGQAENDYDCCD